MKRICFVAILIALACGLALASQNLTYVDLAKRLTDLEGLSVLPVPGEKCMQWSSYDRASYYDEATGKYVAWDANGDGGGIIRQEGDRSVVAEMKGPGCIWRIWSALPQQGHVRIYLDGATEPTIDLPFIKYFDRTESPFTYPALAHTVAKGWNNYVPIPFMKSCKITMDREWGAYYHFTYSIFPEGTTVPTFTRNLSAQDQAALAAADSFLRKGIGSDPAGSRAGQIVEAANVSLSGGSKTVAADIDGPRAITSLWVKVAPELLKNEAVLRSVVLKISWDGERKPSVWVPLGDFFGSGPGYNQYRSLPLGMTENGFYSYWYMPFASNARVEILNDGDAAFAGQVVVTHAPLAKPIEQLGRFHAKWHRDAFLPKEPERWIDWPMVKTQGSGRFCGVMLQIWNPRGGWWGEGDEKFFVDGEKLPSTFGTGSEDYFGYAWCAPELFQNCYHNQTRVTGNVGHVSVNRWHIADNIPFQTSFEGDIEKYYVNKRPTLYASTTYWYLDPKGIDPYGPVPVKDRTFYVQPVVISKPGVTEGETLKVANQAGGSTTIQELSDEWSGNAHLWWTQAKPGDSLELAVPVRKSGKYDLVLQMTKARDYGIVQLYLDGQKLGAPVDLYDPNVVLAGEKSFGTIDLKSGEHRLRVEIVGANDQAIKAYMFGLDYVKLVRK